MSSHEHRGSGADRQDAGRPQVECEDFESAASLAAHEMAGPLSTATAAIDLLRTRLDAEDEIASDLVSTATRHLRIARLQTARLAQLASGPRPPELRSTDLDMLVREVVGDLTLSELAHHPTAVESSGRAEAAVDPDQIRQALYNLLTNAATYSPRGRAIVIEVSQSGDQVLLRVRDQGHGVAPEAADRIFEPYQRGQADAPGLGLGLALSRDIARNHGGDLTLEPAPKGGAEFLLKLPRPETPTH
jgi:two-component system, OmpR family, sensor histidine kinase KdpD